MCFSSGVVTTANPQQGTEKAYITLIETTYWNVLSLQESGGNFNRLKLCRQSRLL